MGLDDRGRKHGAIRVRSTQSERFPQPPSRLRGGHHGDKPGKIQCRRGGAPLRGFGRSSLDQPVDGLGEEWPVPGPENAAVSDWLQAERSNGPPRAACNPLLAGDYFLKMCDAAWDLARAAALR